MTVRAATLDAVDRAFIWRAEQSRRQLPATEPNSPPGPARSAAAVSVTACSAVVTSAAASSAAVTRPAGDHAARGTPAGAASRPFPSPESSSDSIVDRLLRTVPQHWEHLARCVEDARRAGAEVIAVAGARRGEGRTTVVECLARTLAARGRRVACLDEAPLEFEPADHRGGSQDRIVLVDAGVWFPGGPIRRAWLERQSLGCHAAILVRRADQPACDARARVLEAVGLEVLGEVLTMVPPATHSIHVT